jgi:hypothetical protein
MTVIVKHAQRDSSAQELLIEYHVCLVVIGRRLLLQPMKLGQPAALATRANINPTRHRPPASRARTAISAPNLPQLPFNVAALLFTALRRAPSSTLQPLAITPPQLLPPMKRESANCLARLVLLVWEESSQSASRVQPTSPTLLKLPASPAHCVPLGPTKL